MINPNAANEAIIDDSTSTTDEVLAGDSGYSTDQEETEGQVEQDSDEAPTVDSPRVAVSAVPRDIIGSSNTASGGTSSRNLSSMTSSSSLSEGDDSSVDSQVWKRHYLRKKRHLLKRASDFLKQEASYNAAVARVSASEPPSSDSNLWTEAKNILGELCNEEAPLFPMPPPKRPRRMGPPPPKLRPIDFSLVHHFSSQALNDDMNRVLLPTKLYDDGQWMARSLNQIHDQQRGLNGWNENDPVCGPHDPTTSTLSLTLPSKGTIFLDCALVLTEIAQILAQSVPPFAIIHANRSFYEFSGLCPEQVIGRAVETVIRAVHQDTQEDTSSKLDAYLHHPSPSSTARVEDMDTRTPCQIQVLSVRGHTSVEPAPATHVLIRVYPSDRPSSPQSSYHAPAQTVDLPSKVRTSRLLLGVG